MRDISGDLQDRASFLEEQIGAAQAQFENHLEQLTREHQARIEDLRAELDAVTTLMEGEYRRQTSAAVEEERRHPAPQPAPVRQHRAAEPQQFRRPPMAQAEPQARQETQSRPEPQPYRRPVSTEAEPAHQAVPADEERHAPPTAQGAYQRRPTPAPEADPYRQPAAIEPAPQARPEPAPQARPEPAPQARQEPTPQARPVPVEQPEQEGRSAAPQIYRRAPLAPGRERRAAPVSAQPQQQQQQQQPPLADYLIRKLSEAGAMTLEDLCLLAARDGYFAEGESPDRSVQVTLMNVAKAGFIRQLPNGAFAPATVMDTIRLRRAI